MKLFISPEAYRAYYTSVKDALQNPTGIKIKLLVEKYTMTIAALPGLRDILITTLLKLTGFGAAGVKSGSLATLIQSKFYGGYIAKGSIFSYLQSIGATGCFDPTLLSLMLLGGTIFYYFYIYNRPKGKQNFLQWKVKDIL